eukprot:gb/GECH01011998.1/.p1 GENE.gb/GECH01011998.1/~~gb/GECH01011998.1/.p1  ORF type:complete len:973 (+),score=180.50 gb/GECH01011998.1/:1-2919(+)
MRWLACLSHSHIQYHDHRFPFPSSQLRWKATSSSHKHRRHRSLQMQPNDPRYHALRQHPAFNDPFIANNTTFDSTAAKTNNAKTGKNKKKHKTTSKRHRKHSHHPQNTIHGSPLYKWERHSQHTLQNRGLSMPHLHLTSAVARRLRIAALQSHPYEHTICSLCSHQLSVPVEQLFPPTPTRVSRAEIHRIHTDAHLTTEGLTLHRMGQHGELPHISVDMPVQADARSGNIADLLPYIVIGYTCPSNDTATEPPYHLHHPHQQNHPSPYRRLLYLDTAHLSRDRLQGFLHPLLSNPDILKTMYHPAESLILLQSVLSVYTVNVFDVWYGLHAPTAPRQSEHPELIRSYAHTRSSPSLHLPDTVPYSQVQLSLVLLDMYQHTRATLEVSSPQHIHALVYHNAFLALRKPFALPLLLPGEDPTLEEGTWLCGMYPAGTRIMKDILGYGHDTTERDVENDTNDDDKDDNDNEYDDDDDDELEWLFHDTPTPPTSVSTSTASNIAYLAEHGLGWTLAYAATSLRMPDIFCEDTTLKQEWDQLIHKHGGDSAHLLHQFRAAKPRKSSAQNIANHHRHNNNSNNDNNSNSNNNSDSNADAIDQFVQVVADPPLSVDSHHHGTRPSLSTSPSSTLLPFQYRADERPVTQDAAMQHPWFTDDRLSKEIRTLYTVTRPPDTEQQQREQLRHHLEELIRTRFPASELLPFGSSGNGFNIKDADLDLCLVSKKYSSGRKMIRMLADLLEDDGFFHVRPIPHARVPIVKFIDPYTALNVDICINNTLALRNTTLLRTYTRIDPRVAPLGVAIKTWANARGINDAADSTLSSYAWTIMTIHTLQSAGVLPYLQHRDWRPQGAPLLVDGYDATFNSDPDAIRSRFHPNPSPSVGDLLHFFFDYFSHPPLEEHYVSIRGRLPPKKRQRYRNMWRHNHLAIEDPFEVDFNCGRSASRMTKIRKEWQRACGMLTKNKSLMQMCGHKIKHL